MADFGKGFRLKYVELLNWGTFHNDIWRIEPNGKNSLLVGENGSGKSTLVDAITTLLVPPGKITFNKAANAKGKERDFVSYIKGYYKQEQNETGTKGKSISHRYKDKNDATITVIVGCFFNAGYNSYVTLAQLFWIADEKVHRLLMIAKQPITIKEYFSNIDDITVLRKSLQKNPAIELFGDKFKDYSSAYRQYLGIRNDNAIDLFFRTISMKEVEDLSSFVKELMLEKTDVKDQLDNLKKQFDDLTHAHNAVVKARRQKSILEPLANKSVEYEKYEEQIFSVQNIIDSIPSYYANKKHELLLADNDVCNSNLLQIGNAISDLDKDLETIDLHRKQIEKAIDENGGKRIEEISIAINQHKIHKKAKEEKFNQYKEFADFCGVKIPRSEKDFYTNIQVVQGKHEQIGREQDLLREQRGNVAAKRSNNNKLIAENKDQLEILKQRESNIDPKYLKIRSELVTDLGLTEEEIPFIGELLQVNSGEREWEGALERLLRTFAISLIVPQRLYPEVSKYINGKHAGIKLEYYNVPATVTIRNVELVNNSAVDKLEIKKGSEYNDWLQNELEKRFNLQCVNTIQEYQRLDNVLTKEGQFKVGKQRNIKDDRRPINDRRFYVLGWSTKEKIKAVEEELNRLLKQNGQFDEEHRELSKAIENSVSLIENLIKLKTFNNWFEINFHDEEAEILKLETEKESIENANDKLKTLRSQLDENRKLYKERSGERDVRIAEQTTNKNRITNNEEQLLLCTTTLNLMNEAERAKFFPLLDAEIDLSGANLKNIDDEQKKEMRKRTDQKEKIKDKQSEAAQFIVSNMQSFNKEFISEASDLKAEIGRRQEYYTLYHKIVKDGLPEHEAKFKAELKEKTINNLVSFQNYLDEKFKSIAEKIKVINEQLATIEYKNGTYIEISAVPTDDNSIDEFKKELKACFANIVGIEDAYTEERFMQVKSLLDKFKSNETSHINWTEKVTDVRNWRIFNACEKYKADNSLKEFYSGSNAKSGGQKERLAYTILATSLAYQFGLINQEAKTKSFRFVVIDEAFSKSDDESTQFGLKLFEKLHLQLLVITPMQKISIIENFVNNVHYVSKSNQDISEIQNMTVEEYKKNREDFLSEHYKIAVRSAETQ